MTNTERYALIAERWQMAQQRHERLQREVELQGQDYAAAKKQYVRDCRRQRLQRQPAPKTVYLVRVGSYEHQAARETVLALEGIQFPHGSMQTLVVGIPLRGEITIHLFSAWAWYVYQQHLYLAYKAKKLTPGIGHLEHRVAMKARKELA